jgi:hypothetical protein
MRKVVLSSVGLVVLLVTITTTAVLFASGYRLTRENGKTFVEGTGVMVFTSRPDGARVYVNDHLSTATDNTINLQPGDYTVRIEKDGYFSWNKKMTVKQGEVSQANALLFPNTPKLDPLTTTGASNATVDATNTLIAYGVTGAQPRKNGIYLMNMSSRAILPIGGLATQLTDNTIIDFSTAQLSFSPDGDQLLASVSADFGTAYYLLSTNTFNETPQDVTNTILQVQAEWEQDKLVERTRQLRTLPRGIQSLFTKNFVDVKFSPENDKILYTASGSATLNLIKNPPLKGVNSTPQTREIKDKNMYVYDIKEDRNYILWESTAPESTESAKPEFTWHPGSRHLLYVESGRINSIEFDGQNNTTLYAGPFLEQFMTVWPDGSNIAILTNLNIPGAPYNLYKIGLK